MIKAWQYYPGQAEMLNNMRFVRQIISDKDLCPQAIKSVSVLPGFL